MKKHFLWCLTTIMMFLVFGSAKAETTGTDQKPAAPTINRVTVGGTAQSDVISDGENGVKKVTLTVSSTQAVVLTLSNSTDYEIYYVIGGEDNVFDNVASKDLPDSRSNPAVGQLMLYKTSGITIDKSNPTQKIRAAVANEDGDNAVFSDILTVEFDMTVTKPAAPTFKINDADPTIENEENGVKHVNVLAPAKLTLAGGNRNTDTYYTTGTASEAFRDNMTYDELTSATNLTKYPSAGITLSQPQKISAAIAYYDKDDNPIWSDILTVNFTVTGLAKPTFSPAAGAVDAGTQVTIGGAIEDATIYYTTDGTTTPTAESTPYSEPILIDKAMTIKAIAIKGDQQSEVAEAAYTLIDKTPRFPETVEAPAFDPAAGPIESNAAVKWTYAAASSYNAEQYNVTDAFVIWIVGGDTEKSTLENLDAEAFKNVYGNHPGWSLTITPETGKFNTFNGNVGKCKVTEALTIHARVALVDKYNNYKLSPVVSASYTIAGSEDPGQEPTKPAAPTFKVNGAEPTIAREENGVKYVELTEAAKITLEGDGDIYYVVGGADNVFDNVASEDLPGSWANPAPGQLRKYNKFSSEGITIDKTQRIRAAIADDEGNIVVWSNILTVDFTVEGEDPGEDPGEEPGEEPADTVATPKFSPAAGEVEKGTKVTVSCATEGAEIWMAKNGEAFAKQREMTIEEAVTLKAYALKDGVYSDTVSATYTVKTEKPADSVSTPEFSPAAGQVAKGTKVTVSCATEGAEIWMAKNGGTFAKQSEMTIEEAVTLKAYALKDGVYSDTVSATYTVKEVSVEDLELAGVRLYPNPTDGAFNVTVPVHADVEVFNAAGVMIQRTTIGAGNTRINLTKSGIYFVRVTANGQATVRRVIVR